MLIRSKKVNGYSNANRMVSRFAKTLTVERIGGHREYFVSTFDPWSVLWDVPTTVRCFGKLKDASRYYESV